MNLVLDTFAFTMFFKKEPGYEEVKALLEDIENNRKTAFISAITLTELFYIFARYKEENFARAVLGYVKSSNIIVIPISGQIAEKAGELKFRYGGRRIKKGLPIADCIIAATALEKDAMLVTSDDHYKKIKNLKIQWI